MQVGTPLHGCVAKVGQNAVEAGDKSSNDDFEPLHNIFALGDCCANKEQALPALAQVPCLPFDL